MERIGLALSGGGSRGFAHLGAIKALKEKGIMFNVFSGTSAGSIVAALLAAEKTPDEIMETLKDIRLSDALNVQLPVDGLAKLDKFRIILDKVLEGKNFDDLKYELYVCASNLNTGRVEYLNSGNISRAVQASSSIPILFSPVEINGQFYVDGGLLDNIPVKPLIDKCDRIIAIDISTLKKIDKIKGLPEIIHRIFEMRVRMQIDIKEHCDLLIQLNEIASYKKLDTSHNENLFNIGYNHVKNMDL